MRRILLCLVAVLGLSACGAESRWASDEAVRAAAYSHDGPPTVTLFTVVSTRNGSGGHSGLMVDGSQRIMFDPAGTWHHPSLPERNDVFFGMTPKMVNFYIDYHARETYDVVQQSLVVSPEVAEMVAQRALNHGAVAKTQCAVAVSAILSGVPGFESIPRTMSPIKLMKAFGALPGATTRRISDDDADQNHGVLLVQAATPVIAE
jgi:hypothetical protein